ncbi:hypothetical protein NC653_021705 [Populus alba x Populus x berolinensis]|uniref:Uncharacterized protein n=1 Tax=Populus alba x Populus x berolinensis TaxID=444605 RepID=A0AAD6QDZ9_9ROSI|nr:hypothetical protein NC653_021705 [Populus alba x Populus x berolinensis]
MEQKLMFPRALGIQTGTVRDNVLFGKDMSKEIYSGCFGRVCFEPGYWDMGGWRFDSGGRERDEFEWRTKAENSTCKSMSIAIQIAVDAHTAHICSRQEMSHATLVSERLLYMLSINWEFLDAARPCSDGVIVQSGKFEDLIADPTGELV